MAKNKANQTAPVNDTPNPADELAATIAKIDATCLTMESLGMTGAQILQFRTDALAAQVADVKHDTQTAHMDAANQIVSGEAFKAKIELLKGSTFGVLIEVSADGNVTVGARSVVRKQGTGERKSPSGGKRGVVLCADKQYEHWAALCAAYNLAVNGDSAKRVWDRHHGKDPAKYPEAIQVDAPTEDAK